SSGFFFKRSFCSSKLPCAQASLVGYVSSLEQVLQYFLKSKHIPSSRTLSSFRLCGPHPCGTTLPTRSPKKWKHSPLTVQQTPEGSLLDIIRNAYDLLSHCDIKIPKIEGNDKYVDSGPPYLIFLHPALGPLWEVTRQKFHGGSISKGSELQIEVAEFSWRNVQLHGSLKVVAENILGSTRMDENGELKLRYWHRCGRCKLQNVRVLNEGIDWTSRNNTYWKHDVQRFEALKVILHGNAEFEATDVVFQPTKCNGYRIK
ncbi:hypothetical protein LOK49_LG08G00701, partial [Camellia lanceoleosa]